MHGCGQSLLSSSISHLQGRCTFRVRASCCCCCCCGCGPVPATSDLSSMLPKPWPRAVNRLLGDVGAKAKEPLTLHPWSCCRCAAGDSAPFQPKPVKAVLMEEVHSPGAEGVLLGNVLSAELRGGGCSCMVVLAGVSRPQAAPPRSCSNLTRGVVMRMRSSDGLLTTAGGRCSTFGLPHGLVAVLLLDAEGLSTGSCMQRKADVCGSSHMSQQRQCPSRHNELATSQSIGAQAAMSTQRQFCTSQGIGMGSFIAWEHAMPRCMMGMHATGTMRIPCFMPT